MAKASDIARRLIALSGQEPEPDWLSPMRLQKLLYYAQGWSLAWLGRPLFDDLMGAWPHGPVVPAVYREYKQYGHPSIADEQPEVDAALTDAEAWITDVVWDGYKQYAANKLRAMTHTEPPWLNARGDLAEGDRCDEPITLDALRDHFRTAKPPRSLLMARSRHMATVDEATAEALLPSLQLQERQVATWSNSPPAASWYAE